MKQNFCWLKNLVVFVLWFFWENQSSKISWSPSFDIAVSHTNWTVSNDVNFGLTVSYLTDSIITATGDISRHQCEHTETLDTSLMNEALTLSSYRHKTHCYHLFILHRLSNADTFKSIYYRSLSKARIFQVKARINVANHFPLCVSYQCLVVWTGSACIVPGCDSRQTRLACPEDGHGTQWSTGEDAGSSSYHW